MSKEYTGFAISNFRTGFDEAVEPWLLPRDAFQVMKNAHLYRGVLEKISGYNFFAHMSYREIDELTGTIDGINKTFTGIITPPSTNNTIVQSTINAGATQVETFTDDGTGTLTGTNGGTGTIDYTTGAVSVTFGAAAPADLTVGGVQYNSVIIIYDRAANPGLPIMGIKPYISATGSQNILIFDTKRVGQIVVLAADMAENEQSDYGISELPHETQTKNIAHNPAFDGVTLVFTGTVTAPLLPGHVQFDLFASTADTDPSLGTIIDNGDGLLIDADPAVPILDPAGNNFINYATGEWIMTFLAAASPPAPFPLPPVLGNILNFSGCIYGDIFTGDFTNFFVVTNYQSKAFLTNSVDPPMYYDGSCVKFLNTNLSLKPNTIAPYDLTKVLHVYTYRNRLLLISVTDNTENPSSRLNYIYWSKALEPLDFTNDEQEPAPTSEIIRTISEINTDLIVRFSNSEMVFRYTGDENAPFRWDPTNLIWRCDAPYSAINYDSWFSSVGKPAIVGSDGVNVKRVDEIIPDFTFALRIDEQQPIPAIDQTSIGQCYGERFDDFKEGWLCYRDIDDDSLTGIKPSNSVLSFNYLDSTYSVYTFPFSCLGFGRILSEDTWGNAFELWGEANQTWGSYNQNLGALIDLAGDQNGIVYELGFGNSITDMDGNEIPCLFEAITKDFNPFVEAGELVRFGYVDFLVSSNDTTRFRVQFYADNRMDANFDTFFQETQLTLTANQQTKVWKRIYVGAVGKEFTMRIYQSIDDFDEEHLDQPLRIHAIVPYFKAAGRIFN